jgi:hypothetical protein
MHALRLVEIGRGISRSQNSKERDPSKPGLNPDPAVTLNPEMPLQRHVPHQRFSLPDVLMSSVHLQSLEDVVKYA